MTTRMNGPGAGWSWLLRGINLGRSDPKAVFGAVALVMLVALLPSGIQLLLQYVVKLRPQAMLAVMGAMMIVIMVLSPLLFGGVLRVIDAAEHRRPTAAMAVFSAFRNGPDAWRLIGFGLLVSLIYISAFVVVLAILGDGFLGWYWHVLTAAQSAPLSPGSIPAMPAPEHLALSLVIAVLAGMFLSGVYAIGFGQIALGECGIGGALADGVSGTVKNLLPILVLVVSSLLGIVLLALLVVLIGLLIGIAAHLLHPALALVLLLPVYFGMMLVIYVVMFGTMYAMWRDVCVQQPGIQGAHMAL